MRTTFRAAVLGCCLLLLCGFVRGGYVSTPTGGFQGNPNVTISAINATGGIAASRSSGQIPASVQVSAAAITATGTSEAYEDLQYNWDFGDPTGTETFTNPYTGLVENANSAQTGPEATYVYRNVGTGSYTITLTMTGMNGSTPVTTTKTAIFTVSAFSPTTVLYWDSVGGSDSNNGTSPATPKQTYPTILTAIASVSSNTGFNFKCGSSWNTGASNGFNIGSKTLSHVHFQSYGTCGTAPVFNMNGANSYGIHTDGDGSSNQDDIVISGLNFQTVTGFDNTGSGSGAGGILTFADGSGSPGNLSNFFLDNVTVAQNINTTTSTNNVVDFSGNTANPNVLNNVVVWKSSFSGPPGTSSNTRMGLNMILGQWASVIGSSFSGNGTSTSQDHHIYPLMQNHAVFRYNTFNSASGKAFAINCDWNSISGGNETAQYWLISDNLVQGPIYFHDASNGQQNQQVLFSNFVTQRNRINITPTVTGGTINFVGGQSMTWRYNQIWNVDDTILSPMGSTSALYKFYFNYVYVASTAQTGPLFDYWNSSTSPGPLTYTTKFVITDNQIQDQRSSGTVWNLGWTNQSGALIDRNTTYTPNRTLSFGDQNTGKTFSQWQAAGFDPNGLNTNPGFINGAAGQFH